MYLIRPENVEEFAAIREVNELAFGRSAEANLVDALRRSGKVVASLIAIEDEKIIGHIFFSPVVIETPAQSIKIIGLAPMAVLPAFQKRGIGAALVNAGLDACKKSGHAAVIVLGHPHYYPRFGFVPASRFGIKSEYDVRDEAFMALELQTDALTNCAGMAKYQEEFNEL